MAADPNQDLRHQTVTPADAEPDQAPPAGGGDALQAAVEHARAMEAERDAHLDHLRRLAADFDNYKKRQAREREMLLAQANERLVRDLLPVLDDLERAVQAFDEHQPDAIRKGVELVQRALRTILEREGITEIDPEGERFDPHEHEALTTQSVAGTEEGTVVQVIQRG